MTPVDPQALAQRLADSLTAKGLSGSAIAIVTPAGTFLATSGVGNSPSSGAVTGDSVFRIASVTKTMTALAVMQLVELGRIGLDDPVNKYLRSYRIGQVGPRRVTVRDLLRHTGGLGEWAKWREALHPIRGVGPTLGKHIPTIPELHGPVLKPSIAAGERWGYANHGYLALGHIVAEVSGQSWASYVKEHLFDRTGMSLSCAEPLRDDVARHLTVGHVETKGVRQPYEFRHEVGGDGDVYSSIADMARYAEMLINRGQGGHGRVVGESTLDEMWTPQYLLGGEVPSQGLAFVLRDLGGHRTVSHGGNIIGFASALLVAPDDATAVVVLINQSTDMDASATAEVGMCELLGVPRPTDWSAAEVPLDADVRRWAVGTYRVPRGGRLNLRYYGMFGGRLLVSEVDGHLQMRGRFGMLKAPAVLHPVDADNPRHFRAEYESAGFDVWFIQQPDGRRTIVVDRLNAVFHSERSS